MARRRAGSNNTSSVTNEPEPRVEPWKVLLVVVEDYSLVTYIKVYPPSLILIGIYLYTDVL